MIYINIKQIIWVIGFPLIWILADIRQILFNGQFNTNLFDKITFGIVLISILFILRNERKKKEDLEDDD